MKEAMSEGVVRLVALLLLTVAIASPSAAQSLPTSPQRLTVFLDCHSNCDFDLIREEVSYVDWMRERTAADVHLLITSQGAGGSEHTLAFIGQRSMTGQGDTPAVLTRFGRVNSTQRILT